jgi:hypothetical protein
MDCLLYSCLFHGVWEAYITPGTPLQSYPLQAISHFSHLSVNLTPPPPPISHLSAGKIFFDSLENVDKLGHLGQLGLLGELEELGWLG